MSFWVWLLLFDIVVAALLFLVFYGHRKNTDYNPNAINFNAEMTEFYYYVPKPPKTVREFLSHQKKRGILHYNYDAKNDIILFYSDLSGLVGASFDLHLTAVRGGTELHLVQRGTYERQESLALRQNEFWHYKLEACPIPFPTRDNCSQSYTEKLSN